MRHWPSPSITWAAAQIIAEDARGARRRVRDIEVAVPAKTGARLAQLSLAPPEDAVALFAVVRGQGAKGDPLLAVARIDINGD